MGDMAFPFGVEKSVRLKPRLNLRLGTMDIMDTVLDTMVDTMDILMDMDTMDILTDMGMDIMVKKHNNQNAKIGLERTPELSSSNFNQKKTPPDYLFKIKECQKYTAKFYNVSTYFICALFLLLL